ncbi:uncharacterized protein M6B38_403730 [Iris pallida]|uniref:Uncharacterized protein n=1 Tax=Iris pallida TaxID=29817 RepID=A0AAX6FRX6_IRIPA|nr:uncharacterized protein M6B38_403730 [Iris pallida]
MKFEAEGQKSIERSFKTRHFAGLEIKCWQEHLRVSKLISIGTLKNGARLCVSADKRRNELKEEMHQSQYSIYSGDNKMYRNMPPLIGVME